MQKQKEREINFFNDSAFKWLIKNDKINDWFFEIIQDKTGIDLSKFILQDNELNMGPHIKDQRMDLIYKKDTTIVIVEINQFLPEISVIKGYQSLFRVESNQILQGEDYHQIYAKLVMFNNFCSTLMPELLIANFKLADTKNNITKEDIESYEIYLPNYRKMRYNELNEIDKRLWLLGERDVEVMKKLEKDEKTEQVIEELMRLYEYPDFLLAYDEEIHRRKTMNALKKQGIQEGIEKGAKQKEKEIAQSLIKELGIQKTAEITKLSIPEIEELAKESV